MKRRMAGLRVQVVGQLDLRWLGSVVRHRPGVHRGMSTTLPLRPPCPLISQQMMMLGIEHKKRRMIILHGRAICHGGANRAISGCSPLSS